MMLEKMHFIPFTCFPALPPNARQTGKSLTVRQLSGFIVVSKEIFGLRPNALSHRIAWYLGPSNPNKKHKKNRSIDACRSSTLLSASLPNPSPEVPAEKCLDNFHPH